jgi:hypothetical protein
MKVPKKGKPLGVFLIMAGVGLILAATLFRIAGMPDIILGYYLDPLAFIAGGVVLILNKD